MASGGLSRVIMSFRELLPGLRRTNLLGGNFVRTISNSNRGTNNNEPGGTQQDDTIKHTNEEHVEAGETDVIYRDAMSSTERVGDGLSFDSLATEQNSADEGGSSNNMARLLVDELGHVYARYRENINVEEILREQTDEVPEESRETLNKARELYLRALTANGEAAPPKDSGEKTRRCNDFLGIKTVYGDLLRPFSTSAIADSKKGEDCDKAKKLPCLQSSELSTNTPKDSGSSKGVCERFCMPCCKPARDPPICFYPYKKAECVKKKPPRPAFSECKQMFEMQAVRPCECVRPVVGSCKKSKESAKCTK